MQQDVDELKRWRAQEVDPAIRRLEADNREIKATLAGLVTKDEAAAIRDDARSARRWSIVGTLATIVGAAVLAWLLLHVR